MFSNRFRVFSAVSAVFLATLACASPTTVPTTPTPGNSSALALAATQTALAAQPVASPSPQPELPTNTPAPSGTALPAETATETPLPVGVLPSETPTMTPETVLAEVMKVTNCRIGPGGAYDLVTTFQTGVKVEVVARDLGGGYIVVQNPEKPEEQCYILSNNVKLTGDTSILPQYTPLASPTSSPNFTATFKKFDTCKGDVLAQFVVQNTGGMPFRSAYIKVTNLKTGKFAEQVVNAFDLTVGCIIAKNIAPLNPGGSGYLSSAIFKNDPRGNKLRAVIQACTEKGLKGFCVTTSIEIKP
jgi:hypothetical protein